MRAFIWGKFPHLFLNLAFCVAIAQSSATALPRIGSSPRAPYEIDWGKVSEDSRGCVKCHVSKGITGSAIRDWQLSKHFGAGVACADCHLPAKDAAPAITGASSACEDKRVRRAVSPRNCAVCHPDQFGQFSQGKHAAAWLAMTAMPTTAEQPKAIIEGEKGCGGCHRIGRDEGKCDSCHTRHLFAAAEARRPEACMTCHMGFDHPQWEMYSTSKHGSIYATQGARWDWNLKLANWFDNPEKASLERPRAPVCSSCHMPQGDHTVGTAWGFLALRLPEKDPEWLGYRQKILIGLGVLTPEGQPTARLDVVKVGKVARLSAEEWQAARDRMIAVCANCHARTFAQQNLEAADSIIKESDKLMAEAIDIVEGLYRDGILERPKDRPPHPDLLRFYEVKCPIEQKLYTMFLEHRMRSFQGAFHMNPDYQHWYGWAEMKRDLYEIRHEAEALRASRGKSSSGR
ncbi:MAG: cytochrome C [Acidobacteriia bacterium]|nr:cytochrome C [Terriglobia bacterium]